jgi:superfamily II DNA/RNA helicase
MYGFAPETTEAPPGEAEDLFDILVTTDVLSEGVNLQQARNIINYDLPWNPMRLVQRHGRIDRIGSPHKDVYIRCFFPDRRLDELLDLESRIRRKLAQAAASVGVEHEVIPGAAISEIVFSETRAEIAKLRREDPNIFVNAGEDPAAHSGEEYRQELRKGLERNGDRITALPWGSGSGFVGGAERGHFFCARVGERLFYAFRSVGCGSNY